MRGSSSERTKIIIVVFLAFIMISSAFGVIFFGFSSNVKEKKYNGFKFVRSQDILVTDVNGIDAIFSYHPLNVEMIQVSSEIIELVKGKLEIDVTADINDTSIETIALAQYQLRATLSAFDIYVREGRTSANQFNIPIIKCSDASSAVPVIYFKTGNETLIELNQGCITIQSNSIDFIRAKDRIVYGIFGIIK